MKETVRITKDENGNKIAVAEQIQFGGKRRVAWENVEAYLKEEFSGKSYKISETNETIHIGSDFPDEFTNSVYTKKLMGTSAKAKANSVQVLPQMIEIATNKRHENNKKRKHNKDARLGWYRYDSRFALPVFNEAGETERYNIFAVTLLVRCAKDEKMYLYDITEIKKEAGKLFESEDCTQ